MEISKTDAQALAGNEAAPGVDAGAPKPSRFFSRSVIAWALLALCASLYLAKVTVKPGAISAYLQNTGADDEDAQKAALAVDELRDNIERLQVDVTRIKTDLAAKAEQDTALDSRVAALETHSATTAAPTGAVAQGGILPASAVASAAAAGPLKTATKKAVAAAKTAAAAAVATPQVANTIAATQAVATQAAAAIAPAAAVPAATLAPVTVAPATAPAQAVAPAALGPAPALAPAPANAAAAIAPPLKADAAAAPAGVKMINAPLSQSSAVSRAAPVVAAATAAPAPVTAPAPANAAEALAPKFETGSVQNLGATVPAAAPAATGPKPIGIYIGSGPSVDSLRLSWSLLSDRNADSLRSLQPRYTTGIDANGLNYGLVAGPLNSAADAQKVCKDLAAKAITCRIGDFTGEAL